MGEWGFMGVENAAERYFFVLSRFLFEGAKPDSGSRIFLIYRFQIQTTQVDHWRDRVFECLL